DFLRSWTSPVTSAAEICQSWDNYRDVH
ncbi:MAG: hypothetical protein JWL62_2816, partial [Hyphomicrobiales bacterium]|nr:hypothetical protein [Hyphomicrobiales bacterium]